MRKITIKSKKAFTLVELMIAIGIIILLFALSITSLVRTRMTANETTAIKALKTLHAAFASYRVVNSAYPESLAVLGAEDPPYIDDLLESGIRQGYEFEVVDADENIFIISAIPVSEQTGGRSFWIRESGEMVQQGSEEAPMIPGGWEESP